MKLIQLDYRQPCYRGFLVVVEIPDDFPEEKVPELLSGHDLSALSAVGEVYDLDEPAECSGTSEISEADGSPHFRLQDGQLRKAGS